MSKSESFNFDSYIFNLNIFLNQNSKPGFPHINEYRVYCLAEALCNLKYTSYSLRDIYSTIFSGIPDYNEALNSLESDHYNVKDLFNLILDVPLDISLIADKLNAKEYCAFICRTHFNSETNEYDYNSGDGFEYTLKAKVVDSSIHVNVRVIHEFHEEGVTIDLSEVVKSANEFANQLFEDNIPLHSFRDIMSVNSIIDNKLNNLMAFVENKKEEVTNKYINCITEKTGLTIADLRFIII